MTTSSLDELIAKSTIEFPTPLQLEELKDLFGYLVRISNYDLDVSYSVEQARIISAGVPSYSQNETKIVSGGVPFDRLRSTSVNGTIYETGEFHASATFSCKELQRTADQFSAIAFSTIPGYSLEEHSKNERQLWDFVREKVTSYFSLKSQHD